MIKVAIVDDSREEGELLTSLVQKTYQSHKIMVETQTFTKAQNILYELDENKYIDLVLADIEMPEMNGLELAEEIRKRSKNIQIIFITSHTKYAIDGYSAKAYAYLLKSLVREKLPAMLVAVYQEIMEEIRDVYCIRTSRRYEKLSYKEIYYMYKIGKYSVIVTENREIKLRKSLNDICEELDDIRFVFIDRGFVINIDHLVSMTSGTVKMRDGFEKQVTPARIHDVKRLINENWRKTK